MPITTVTELIKALDMVASLRAKQREAARTLNELEQSIVASCGQIDGQIDGLSYLVQQVIAGRARTASTHATRDEALHAARQQSSRHRSNRMFPSIFEVCCIAPGLSIPIAEYRDGKTTGQVITSTKEHSDAS